MKLRQAYQRYPLTVLVGALVVVGIVSVLVTNNTLAGQVMGTSIVALVVTILLLIFVPFVLGGFLGRRQESNHEDISVMGSLLLAAVLGGVCSILFMVFGATEAAEVDVSQVAVEDLSSIPENNALSIPDAGTLVQRIVLIILLCVVTAIHEEGFFRGLLVPCVTERAKIDNVGVPPQFFAAVFSALVFGLIHLSGIIDALTGVDPEEPLTTVIIVIQGFAKIIQTGLFGFCVATMFVRTQSIWFATATHALFDFLYMGPAILLTGELATTYYTGDVGDLVVVVLTIILLLPPSAKSLQWLRQNTQQ